MLPVKNKKRLIFYPIFIGGFVFSMWGFFKLEGKSEGITFIREALDGNILALVASLLFSVVLIIIWVAIALYFAEPKKGNRR